MALFTDEIFGPVLSMLHVDTLDDAITLIENQRYGNAASIFTQDGAAAREFRYRAPTGNIGINVGVAAPMAYFPFSGAKESFFGTLHGQGRDAIDFFTERKVGDNKVVLVSHVTFFSSVWGARVVASVFNKRIGNSEDVSNEASKGEATP